MELLLRTLLERISREMVGSVGTGAEGAAQSSTATELPLASPEDDVDVIRYALATVSPAIVEAGGAPVEAATPTQDMLPPPRPSQAAVAALMTLMPGGAIAGEHSIASSRAVREALDAQRAFPIDAGLPEKLFGVEIESAATCPAGHVAARPSRSTVLELVYPPHAQPTFAEVLGATLNSSKRTRAWCEGCKSYVHLTQSRVATSAPRLLCLAANAPPESPQRALWTGTRTAAAAAGPDGGARVYPQHRAWLARRVVLAKAGAAAEVVVTDESDVAPDTPPQPAAQARGGSAAGGGDFNATYELVAAVVHVLAIPRTAAGASRGAAILATAPPTSKPSSTSSSMPHFVAAVRVGADDGAYAPGRGYAHGGALTSSSAAAAAANGSLIRDWLVFSDFRVTPVPPSDVVDFRAPWKTPVLLLYARVDTPATGAPTMPQTPELAARRLFAGFRFALPTPPLAADVMRVPRRVFNLPAFIPRQVQTASAAASEDPPVPPHALPRAGGLVAVDAEFVALTTEKTRIAADGSRRTIEQALLTPGRLSVVDARGAAAANSGRLLDHYVCATTEPIVDHLTRFSGLAPGDLDPSSSSHRLHAFKETYMRLRALVDGGAVFVGHGLRKDFSTLGVWVRKAQIIDTVHIYRLPGQRALSLKFLASHVLRADIQVRVNAALLRHSGRLSLHTLRGCSCTQSTA